MSLQDQIINRLPEYYDTMYLDGYTPEEIRTALKASMLKDAEDEREDSLEIIVSAKGDKR